VAEHAAHEDVAIVGMACIFPGAPDLATYWQNIVRGVDAVGDPPAEWDADLAAGPGGAATRVYTRRGGYLGELARFDPAAYGVMPRAVDGGEPDHYLALRVAHEALADAGYRDRRGVGERTAVILGRGTYVNRGYTTLVQHAFVVDQTVRIVRELHPEWEEPELARLRDALAASLPPFTAETAPGLVPNIVSGRIANRLDFMGPNFTVDAACASALIAVELALRELATGECDLAVAGGVHVSTPPPIHMIFCELGALSRRGEIRPFDRRADGTLMGEGVGMVVLKRRRDAERDGDRIYALVKAVGVASDGRALGLLAPRLEGELLALRRAYARSGIDPRTVGLIEAHGTGTPVGDATEVRALRELLGPREGSPTVALGSVKSMIGHTLPAAGIAGLIKAALALYHRVLPPTLHCEEPDPRLGLQDSPLYVNSATRPWIHGGPAPRRAGVNAFGFGGINAHAILEEHPTADAHPSLDRVWPTEVLVLEAPSRIELARAAGALADYLARRPDVALVDLAYTLGVVRRRPGPAARLAIVAASVEEAARKLVHARTRLEAPDARRIRDVSGIYFAETPLGGEGRVAFLFPGEGSQYPGMLGELCLHFPEVRRWFDLMDAAFVGHPRGFRPSQVVFPPPGAEPDPAAADARLWRMDAGAEVVFAASQGLHALLTALALRPDAVVGHSTGEYSALLAAGALRPADDQALREHVRELNGIYETLAARRAIPEGVLLTVAHADPAAVARVLAEAGEDVFLAMDNCPHQLVLCATAAVAPTVRAALARAGALCGTLPFARAYHTPRFAPVAEALRAFYAGLPLAPPRVPLYSCVTAARYPETADGVRELALAQWARPVRFRETVEAMWEAGVRLFVEVGPRNTLTAFVDDILRGRPHLAVAADVPGRSGLTQLNHLVAQLVVHGVPLALDRLYARRTPRALALDASTDAPPRPAGARLALGLGPMRLAPEVVAALRRARPGAERIDRAGPDGGSDRDTAAAVAPTATPAAAPAGGPVCRPAPALDAAGAPAPVPGAVDGRHAAVRAFLGTMRQFLETQEAVLGAALARTGARAGPAGPARPRLERRARAAGPLPLLGTVVRVEEGRTLVAERVVDLEEDRYLRDHTLGGCVSAVDPTLLGLPVMPLTMSLELLGEAALALDGRQLVGLRQVRAHRWIAFDEGRLALRVTARRLSADTIHVEAREAATAPPSPPLVEAIAVVADTWPTPPAVGPFALRNARPSRWTPERLYAEGMFHGPSLRGVASVDRWGEDGMEATLVALPVEGLLRSDPAPCFVTDPVLLDAAGQVIGYWAAEHLPTGFNVFPYAVEALDLYGPPLAPPARATCRARIALVGDALMRSDIDVIAPDGRLHARLTGWWDRRFELPPGFYRARIAPCEAFVSEPWAPARAAGEDAEGGCVREDLETCLAAGQGIWERVLAHLVLGPAERAAWHARTQGGRARTTWLLGRVAAKDAVRRLLERRYGLRVAPADVEIDADPQGRPVVRGAWAARLARVPAVSIAHIQGLAVAVAVPDGAVGVDVERLDRVRDDFGALALGEAERASVAALRPVDSREWELRCWCAKEAVGKALGRGLGADPSRLVVERLDPGGRVGIRVREAEPAEVAWATTGRDDAVVWAVSRRCTSEG